MEIDQNVNGIWNSSLKVQLRSKSDPEGGGKGKQIKGKCSGGPQQQQQQQ